MARRLGRVDLELAALDAVSSISTIQGLYAGHWPLVERRLRLVERYEDFWEYGDAYALASWHTGDVGKWREAARFGIDGAKHVLAEIPGIGMHALARACIGLFHTGEWDDLLAAFARIREALGERADGPPAFVSVAYAVALVASEARGESVAADRLLPVIENIGRDRRIGTPTADPFVARFLGRRGRWEEAFAQLDRHADDSSVRAHVFAARCDLLADAGRWDEAEAFVKPARAWAELAGLEALPFFADRLEGRLLRSRGEDEAAIAAMERAAEGFHELDAPWEQAVTELHLAEALVGQGRDAREPLERGLLVFERIGALREAETARALADRG